MSMKKPSPPLKELLGSSSQGGGSSNPPPSRAGGYFTRPSFQACKSCS